MQHPRTRLWLPMLSVCVLASGIPAVAQELEEIVVTATKREQSLQDVALSVTAIQGDFVTNMNITNFETLNVTNFKVPRAGMGDNSFIRGIGSGPNYGFEQSVPYFMDGIYFGRGRASRMGFLDLERIEVVKGPQPTYLGKNAIAGAANIVWAQPTDEFEGYVAGSYEAETAETSVTGVISGPLSDRLSARGAIRWREVSKGWIRNTFTNNDEPQIDDLTLRATFLWEPTDTAALTFTGFHSADVEKGRNQQTVVCPSVAGFLNFIPENDCTLDRERTAYIDPEPFITPTGPSDLPMTAYEDHLNSSFNDFEITGGTFKAEFQLESGTLTAITGYYDFGDLFTNDADQTRINAIYGNSNEIFDQLSQEIRFVSAEGDRLNWLAGFYYDSIDNRQVNQLSINLAALMGGMGPMFHIYVDNQEQAESWAVFGEATINTTDAFRVNLGFRYSVVDKDFSQEACQAAFPRPGDTRYNCVIVPHYINLFSDTFEKFQPAVTLEWDLNDESMVYANYKQGFKAGGYDFGQVANAPESTRYDQEEVDAWEVGAKLGLADGAATLNLAWFSAEYTDLQVTAFNPVLGVVNVFNAGGSTSQGLELEANWAVSNEVTLGGTLAFLDSVYDSFPGAACHVSAEPPEYPDCDASKGPRRRDLAGENTLYAPDVSGTLTLDWRKPLENGMQFHTFVNLFNTAEFFTSADNDPLDIQEGYTKLDVRFGLEAADANWDVAAVIRNVTDELTCAFRGDIPGSFGPADPVTGAAESGHFCLTERPRTIALQGRYRF